MEIPMDNSLDATRQRLFRTGLDEARLCQSAPDIWEKRVSLNWKSSASTILEKGWFFVNVWPGITTILLGIDVRHAV